MALVAMCQAATGHVYWLRVATSLGRVEVGFQPDPGLCQVQKTQETMGVFVVAGGHAPPP